MMATDTGLTIFKASAGSGKTFQLVGEYLRMLYARPTSYRQILAVTFTNKATAEMKERILKELANLAGGGELDAFLGTLVGFHLGHVCASCLSPRTAPTVRDSGSSQGGALRHL